MQNSIQFFFIFKPGTDFVGKFGPNNQNWQFKLKFGI